MDFPATPSPETTAPVRPVDEAPSASEPSRVEKRRATLAAKKAKREADRARREARKAAAEPAQPAQEAPAEEIDETRLKRELGALLGLVWRLASGVARLFGGVQEPLTEAQKAKHAEHWLPIALDLPWLRRLCRLTAPLLIVEDFIAGLKRKRAKSDSQERAA